MLVLGFNLNLIISGKTVHEGEHLATHTLIQNLIYKWCGEVVLRTGTIQIGKSMHMRIAPYFLSTGVRFETHSIKGTK